MGIGSGGLPGINLIALLLLVRFVLGALILVNTRARIPCVCVCVGVWRASSSAGIASVLDPDTCV